MGRKHQKPKATKKRVEKVEKPAPVEGPPQASWAADFDKPQAPSVPQVPRPSESGVQTLEGENEGQRNLTPSQKADIVKKHIVVETDEAAEESHQHLFSRSAGDVLAPIYRWAHEGNDAGGSHVDAEDAGASSIGGSRRRSHSVSSDTARDNLLGSETGSVDGSVSSQSQIRIHDLVAPGGFRRDYLFNRKNSRPASTAGSNHYESLPQSGTNARKAPVTKSFIEFLSLYGHFGGEDLEDIPEEEGEDIEAQIHGPNERSALLRKGVISAGPDENGEVHFHENAGPGDIHGTATPLDAVMMLLKSFIGTGVLFLGKAFMNGGILFSAVLLSAIAMISLFSFLQLVKTRLVIPGSFGDIGGILYGPTMRQVILASIVLSQIGFVSAYLIFVAENLVGFFTAVSYGSYEPSTTFLIFAQLVIFIPLALVRSIQKLSFTALVADAFILFGLVYIFGTEFQLLGERGVADVQLFNSRDFSLLIGTAVFSFEGVGLVIPITESMAEPGKFPRILTWVMVVIMVLFSGAGVLAYAAYGSEIQTVVFLNLPQHNKVVNASQLLYSLAILLSIPLQFFPAVRIMETSLFTRSGKYNIKVKWQKNALRICTAVGCALIAVFGAADLDKFVSVVGSLACVPLCFCYPAMLHYKACAVTLPQKAADIALFLFGLIACLFTTFETLRMLMS